MMAFDKTVELGHAARVASAKEAGCVADDDDRASDGHEMARYNDSMRGVDDGRTAGMFGMSSKRAMQRYAGRRQQRRVEEHRDAALRPPPAPRWRRLMGLGRVAGSESVGELEEREAASTRCRLY